ncbi:MAG: transcriptional repressor LexA [Cyanobacteria bacterium P01_H01_bin.74]
MRKQFHVEKLTPKQSEVLSALIEFLIENRYPPTIQQLCSNCGVRSTSTIHFHLTALKKKKIINWNPAEKRAISVRQDIMDAYHTNQEDKREHSQKSTLKKEKEFEKPAYQLPLLGTIAAGSPLQTTAAQTEREAWEVIDLSADICPTGCYALKVRGESMIEDHIMDGDIVVINPKSQIREGDAVVALIEGEMATLKHYFKEKNRVRLEPANVTMEPIYATDICIQGKVEAIIRRYT